MKLEEKTALITGGSQGLGLAIAEKYLSEGADVAICARNPVELESARAQLAVTFPERQVYACACDVSDEQQVNALVRETLVKFGQIDVLVLNAGIYGPMGLTEEVDLAEWRRAIDINLFGILLPCRVIIPHFKNQKKGKIVILSGGGATNPLPNISAYAASKAAAVRLMETLAEELRDFGIDVNAIAPGALATRLVDEVIAAGPEKVGGKFFEKNRAWKESGAVPLALGAGLAVYLGSRESDGITGKLISAQWDPWANLQHYRDELGKTDIYCLRRIVPEDRGFKWS